MKRLLKTTLIAFGTIGAIAGPLSIPAYAASPAHIVQTAAHSSASDFVKKKYDIKGEWKIVEENGQTLIRFSNDFKTKSGPDLKVFLSPTPISSVNSQTATDGSVLLGVLKSKKGAQDYIIPEDVNLSNFASVLIHCKAFSVLWGGGAI